MFHKKFYFSNRVFLVCYLLKTNVIINTLKVLRECGIHLFYNDKAFTTQTNPIVLQEHILFAACL